MIFSSIRCANDENTVSAFIGPEGGSITSSDGRLTLDFPAGALDEETLISISKIFPAELGHEFDGLDPDHAYSLEPDGLEFNIPIKASLMQDDSPVQQDSTIEFEVGFVFILSNGDLQLLDNLIFELDADSNLVMVSGEIDHFSTIITSISDSLVGKLRVDVSGIPNQMLVADTFTSSVLISAEQPLKSNFILGRLKSVGFPSDHDFHAISIEPTIKDTSGEFQTIRSQSTHRCAEAGRNVYFSIIEIEIESLSIILFVLNNEEVSISITDGAVCIPDPDNTQPSPTPIPTPPPTPTPIPPPSELNGVSIIVDPTISLKNVIERQTFNVTIFNASNKAIKDGLVKGVSSNNEVVTPKELTNEPIFITPLNDSTSSLTFFCSNVGESDLLFTFDFNFEDQDNDESGNRLNTIGTTAEMRCFAPTPSQTPSPSTTPTPDPTPTPTATPSPSQSPGPSPTPTTTPTPIPTSTPMPSPVATPTPSPNPTSSPTPTPSPPGQELCADIGCDVFGTTCDCNVLCPTFGTCCPDFDAVCL
jgi:hypothetical protein